MKAVTAILALSLVLGLSACGGSSKPAAKSQAQRTHKFVAPSTTADPMAAYNAAIDKWNALPQSERDPWTTKATDAAGGEITSGFALWAKSQGLPSEDPTGSGATTATVAPGRSPDGIAIAKRLGCVSPTSSVPTPFGGLPTPALEVDCTIGGVDITIDVMASHADLVKLVGAGGQATLCALAEGFNAKPPFYDVNGDDFTVSAQTHGGDDGTLAQAQALSKALSLPVTTIKC